MIKAIYYCHSIGICHRDQKPENFLFQTQSDDSTLKLIDFGLSINFFLNPTDKEEVFESTDKEMPKEKVKTELKQLAGTAFYMAPEVIAHNYNEKCDLWSAGVIMYIQLSGHPPFYGMNDSDVMEEVKKGKLDFSGIVFDISLKIENGKGYPNSVLTS